MESDRILNLNEIIHVLMHHQDEIVTPALVEGKQKEWRLFSREKRICGLDCVVLKSVGHKKINEIMRNCPVILPDYVKSSLYSAIPKLLKVVDDYDSALCGALNVANNLFNENKKMKVIMAKQEMEITLLRQVLQNSVASTCENDPNPVTDQMVC